jgi:hypothetical protein
MKRPMPKENVIKITKLKIVCLSRSSEIWSEKCRNLFPSLSLSLSLLSLFYVGGTGV